MCGAASRRGSDDSYQELSSNQVQHPGTEDITTCSSEQNAMYLKMIAPATTGTHSVCGERRLSLEDWRLLEAITTKTKLTKTAGRFLSMHKRRRKRLITRMLNTAILDDIAHGQVQRILERCGQWAFNAFALETAAGGRSLPVLCVHLFHWYGLLDHFNLDVVRVWKLFALIEEGYHNTNPYHNSIHATDVTQAMHCFLQEEKIKKHITPLEVMAALIGAVSHDLDHPGVNQPFLIATSNHLAALYENTSVLENHHWRSAVGCLLESGVAEQLASCRDVLEEQIRSLILATDITRQQEFLSRLRSSIDADTLDMSSPDDRHFILQIALKCADISNPTRPWDISRKWSIKVCEEFFRQGDFERKLNLPVTSLCDRYATTVPKIQSGFFRYVVTPLFTEWHRFLQSDLSTAMTNHLNTNRNKWEELELAEAVQEQTVRTEISEAPEPPEHISEVSSERSSSEALLPSDPNKDNISLLQIPPTSCSRRHSVPVNVAKFLIPPSTRMSCRRESLPVPAPHIVTTLVEDRTHTDSPMRSISERKRASTTSPRSPCLYDSDLSLISNASGNGPYSSSMSAPRNDTDRLSAENLLPEPTIASMTAVGLPGSASSATTKCLTRQQTFPPLQPYTRARYLSTTTEMTICKETLHEDESRSTSVTNSHEKLPFRTPLASDHQMKNQHGAEAFIAELQYQAPPPPLERKVQWRRSKTSSKRSESSESYSDKEKAPKIAKFEESTIMGQKENFDPKKTFFYNLSKRRGSAPATSIKVEENAHLVTGIVLRTDYKFHRRGSMPAEIKNPHLSQDVEDNLKAHRNQLHTSQSDPDYFVIKQKFPRRGSVPADISLIELSKIDNYNVKLTRHSVSLNGKPSSAKKNKNKLKRRSSGGTEKVCLISSGSEKGSGLKASVTVLSDTSMLWHKWKREMSRRASEFVSAETAAATVAALTTAPPRRGSLPIEVFTVGRSVKLRKNY